jgi:hypothetical protein
MAPSTWNDPPLPAPKVGPIRLVAAGGSVAIYRGEVGPATAQVARYPYQTTLVSIAVTGRQPPDIVIPQKLANLPSFDLVDTEDKGLTLAIESFGGAANALVLGSADQGKVAVQATYRDFNDYRFPRFVRGAAAPGKLVTTIANGDALVIMSGTPPSPTDVGLTADPFVKLADATSGLAIATTPPNGRLQGAALLAKSGNAGPPLLATGDFLGTLTLTSLSNGRAMASPVVLFGPGVTYAFDADIRSDLILVLASTNSGPQLVGCNPTSGKTTPVAWPDGDPPPGTRIANPTVLAVPGAAGSRVFYIAFFEFVADVMKGIRYAELDLSTIP